MKKKRCITIRESEQVLGKVPYEVIFDIFIRLSIRDILRCRCVSKSWFSLISDPQFIRYHLNITKDHLNMAKRVGNLGSQWPRLIAWDKIKYTDPFRPHGYKKLDLILPVDRNLELMEEPELPDFLCSYDGLVLIGRGKKDHFLWNPCMRSYKQIPEIPCDFSNYQHCLKMYGIGYDMSTDAYKFVRIFHILKPKINRRLEFTARTYNCKTKHWKKISDDFPYKIFKNAQGITVNGIPHWIVSRENNENEYVIIYFDVVDDTIEELETPLPTLLGRDSVLSNFEGSLRLVTTSKTYYEVCILQEDGATKRWKKLFRIKKHKRKYYAGNGSLNIGVENFVPLCNRNKEILFEVRLIYLESEESEERSPYYFHEEKDGDVQLLTYNLETKADKSCITRFLNLERSIFRSTTYVESLVAPNQIL